MLKIDNKNQKDLFKILDDFSSLNLLNLLKMIPCKNIKSVKTLTRSKENEKSTLSSKEPLKRLNKEKSKELTVNDLQHEINIIKQEISELNIKIEIINMMSTKIEMNPVNGLFFLKVLIMFSLILNLLLSIKYFFQNGLQKLKLLFLLIIISLLLP